MSEASGRGSCVDSSASVLGIDGCRGGWVVVRAAIRDRLAYIESVRVVPELNQIRDALQWADAIAIDIPIGLPCAAEPGGRSADRLARKVLGRRAASVFAPPIRATLDARDYQHALALSRRSSQHALGLSKQAFNLIPKIREVDRLLESWPDLQRRIYETHPELGFAMMRAPTRQAHLDDDPIRGGAARGVREAGQAGGVGGFEHAKSTPRGIAERLGLVERTWIGRIATALPGVTRARCKPDDIIDAHACVWTARRIVERSAISLPPLMADSPDPRTDAHGRPMRITA